MRGLSLVVASRGHSSSRCAGPSPSRPLLLRSTGSRRAGSVIVAHRPSCSTACGIFPDQGSNPCPLHWQADSQPLRHQGSPTNIIFDGYETLHPGCTITFKNPPVWYLSHLISQIMVRQASLFIKLCLYSCCSQHIWELQYTWIYLTSIREKFHFVSICPYVSPYFYISCTCHKSPSEEGVLIWRCTSDILHR